MGHRSIVRRGSCNDLREMSCEILRTRPRIWVVLIYSIISFLYLLDLASTIFVLLAMRAPGQPEVMTATQELPQSDFAMFWYSGKQILMNFANSHGYHVEPTAWMKATFQVNLVESVHPFILTWLYPPTMALMASLYSLLPLALSFWVWRGVFLLISAYVLREAKLEWWVIIFGLGCPAELHDIVGGQNGALTGGILVSALLLVDSRPCFAGGLASLLSIKPQLGISLPVTFLSRRRWPALVTFAAGVTFLVALTIPLMGWSAWRWFLLGASQSAVNLVSAPLRQNFPAAGVTVFFMARSLGATVHQAWFFQLISSCLATYFIWKLWQRKTIDQAERMALTVTASILMTPYGYLYDLVGFSIAMVVMLTRAKPHQKPVFWMLWLFAGYTGPLANWTGIIWMPVVAVFGVIYMWFFVRSDLPNNDVFSVLAP